MKVTYDPNADAMYIYLSDKKSTRTEEIADNFSVDFNGKIPVGIEIIGVSDQLPKDQQNNLTISLVANSKNDRKFI